MKALLIALLPLLLFMPVAYASNDWVTVEIEINPFHLNDPQTGLDVNCDKTGDAWERPGVVLFKKQAQLLAQSPVGVRIHGGSTRCENPKSYKTNFRKEYGSQEIPQSILFPGSQGKFKKLVLKRSGDFVNLVAMRIARQIGDTVFAIEPVLFKKNGVVQGAYFAAEDVSEKTVAKYLGHDQFEMYEFKNDEDTEKDKLLDDLNAQIMGVPQMTFQTAAQIFDLENFSKHVLTFVFNGNPDWRQGAAVHNLQTGLWQFVGWDMDHSFIDYTSWNLPEVKRLNRPGWAKEGMQLAVTGLKFARSRKTFYNSLPFRKWDPRELMFYRLWRESPEYRTYFMNLAVDTFEERLTPEVLSQIVQKFSQEADGIPGVDRRYFAQMQVFMKNRWNQFLKPQLEAFARSPVVVLGKMDPNSSYSKSDFNFGNPAYVWLPDPK